MPEQHAAGFGPNVLTLQEEDGNGATDLASAEPPATGGLLLTAPRLQPIAETDLAFYRRKQNSIAVRHVSGDRLVAMVEIVSPGNKAARSPLRDPEGLHNEIWQEVAGVEYTLPAGRPLTLAAYDSGDGVRAYVVHAGVGAALASMPLFLEPRKAVDVPLEATYNAAFADVPRRWRRVLDSS